MDEITVISTPDDTLGVGLYPSPTIAFPTEFRGKHPNTNNITNTNTTITNTSENNAKVNNNKPKTTYAAATAATDYIFPEPNQGVIIEAAPNTPLRDYQVAVGKIVNNQNITFSSRMSRNRVCIYLKTEELTDTFVAKNPYIIINNNKINVHKLRSKAKRITLSEVPPFINNIRLTEQLKINNIQVLSPLILLKSNIKDPEFAHVYSFRRQALLKHTDNTKELPESMLIEFEGECHRIFLSNDDIRCSACNNRGHLDSRRHTISFLL